MSKIRIFARVRAELLISLSIRRTEVSWTKRNGTSQQSIIRNHAEASTEKKSKTGLQLVEAHVDDNASFQSKLGVILCDCDRHQNHLRWSLDAVWQNSRQGPTLAFFCCGECRRWVYKCTASTPETNLICGWLVRCIMAPPACDWLESAMVWQTCAITGQNAPRPPARQ